MKIIFLGTNGWYDSSTGNTISTLIKTRDCNIILDAGNGLCKADGYLDNKKPTFIFLSHLHLDHLAGIHSLAKFDLPKGLTVYVPSKMKSGFDDFFASPYTMGPAQLSFETIVKTSRKNFSIPGAEISTQELVHPGGCLGYRITTEKKVIVYCTDTGMCKNAFLLAAKADLLISECALRKGQDDRGWPHLTPEDAANLAKKANVKKLILTHFDAYNYSTKTQRTQAQNFAKQIFLKTVAAKDGMEIAI